MKNASKITAAKVLTANRLSDGISVWYALPDVWAEKVEKAYAVSTPEEITALEAIAADFNAKGQHCDLMLIDVEKTAAGLKPLKLRERIRADGPTITYDTGSYAADVKAA